MAKETPEDAAKRRKAANDDLVKRLNLRKPKKEVKK